MQRLKFCGTRNNRLQPARRFLVQKLQLYIKWLREDLGRMGTTESDVSRFLTHIIKWAKSQKDKKGRDDQFREGSWVSPPPFRSDLSFWPFFPNGISFVGKFLTSFGLIISLYKIFEKERTAVCSARTSFLLPGFLLSLQPTFAVWDVAEERWGLKSRGFLILFSFSPMMPPLHLGPLPATSRLVTIHHRFKVCFKASPLFFPLTREALSVLGRLTRG